MEAQGVCGWWSLCQASKILMRSQERRHFPVVLAVGAPMAAAIAQGVLPPPPIPIRHMNKQALSFRAGVEVGEDAVPVVPLPRPHWHRFCWRLVALV
eukprot:9382277-Heterocapsa_arctica.AAC.1